MKPERVLQRRYFSRVPTYQHYHFPPLFFKTITRLSSYYSSFSPLPKLIIIFFLKKLVGTSICHARMHGLIHDGRLRACPSYLLGLMYSCRVNVRS
jgi:hypothetical protein